MNGKYNVLINYLGDGDFKFTVKKIGEVVISKTRPVYIYNADVDVINSLRTLRRMLIEIVIGAKPTGAYKIYNMEDYDKPRDFLNDYRVVMDRRGYEVVTNNDIKSILSSGSNGPIEIEGNKVESVSGVDKEEEITGEVVDEVVITKPKKPTKKSTSQKTTKKVR